RWVMERVSSQQMNGFSTTHRAGQGPVPSSPLRDYNVMTRNTYLQGEWEISTAQSVEGLDFGMAPIPQVFDKPAVQADSHTFILPRKDRSPQQRQQAMEFIKTMLDQSMIWAEGGHVPAYMPTAESEEYLALEPQRYYAEAADYAVYDDAAWYGGSGSTFEDTVGAQLGLVQQGVLSPEQALAAIRNQLAIYTSTPSPL